MSLNINKVPEILKEKISYILISLFPKIIGLVKDLFIIKFFFGTIFLDDFFAIFAIILFPLSLVSSAIETYVLKNFVNGLISEKNIFYIYLSFVIISYTCWFLFLLLYYFEKNNIEIDFISLVMLTIYYFATGFQKMFYTLLQAINQLRNNFLIPVVTPMIILVLILYNQEDYIVLYYSLALSSLIEVLVTRYIYLKNRKNFLSVTGGDNYVYVSYPKHAYKIGKYAVSSIFPSIVPLFEVAKLKSFVLAELSIFSTSLRLPMAASSVVFAVLSVTAFRFFISSKQIDFQKLILVLKITFLFAISFFLFFQISSEYLIYMFYSDALPQSDILNVIKYQKLLSFDLSISFFSIVLWRFLLSYYDDIRILILPNIAAILQIFTLTIFSDDLETFVVFGKIIPSVMNLLIYIIVVFLIYKKGSVND